MKHSIAPFFCDSLLIRIEAEIDLGGPVVRELKVFKVGETGFDDIEISSALTKEERKSLNQAVIDDFECRQRPDDGLPDPFELSKICKEEAS